MSIYNRLCKIIKNHPSNNNIVPCHLSIQQHPHGVRMAESTLRRIQPLIFDENIPDNFVNFEREWKVYQIAALSEKNKKMQAYTLLNLAGPDAILKSESFEYGNNESKEDPEQDGRHC